MAPMAGRDVSVLDTLGFKARDLEPAGLVPPGGNADRQGLQAGPLRWSGCWR